MQKKQRWWKLAVLLPLTALCLWAYPCISAMDRQSVPAGSMTGALDELRSQIPRLELQTEQLENALSSAVSSDPPVEESSEDSSAPIFSLTEAERQELDKLIASYGRGVSVYYKSLVNGDVYEYAANTEYYIASIVKAPYALYIYQMADEGLCDLSQTYPYKAAYNQGDQNILFQKSDERVYTLGDLLEVMIRYSNNTAFRMVREFYPIEGFLEFVRTLGLENETCMDSMEVSVIRGGITAHDAGILMENIYAYIESNAPNAKKFKEDLLHTEQPMLQSHYPMARKLGSWDGAMHDMAIVYAPEPYILAVCTNRGHSDDNAYREADYIPFTEISESIERLSQNNQEPAG